MSPDHADLAAVYIDARTHDSEFRFHISASSTTDPDRDIEEVYRLMPDMFGEEQFGGCVIQVMWSCESTAWPNSPQMTASSPRAGSPLTPRNDRGYVPARAK